MRKFLLIASIIAPALLAGGCAKQKSEITNEQARRYFEAWMHVHHKDLVKKDGSHGIYILEETAPGQALGWDGNDINYVIVRSTVTDLDGNISSSTYDIVNKRLGKYDASYYYGPQVWVNSYAGLPAGVKEMLDGMTIGQTRTAIIPGWLMGYAQYDTEEEYLANITEYEPAIYTVELVDTAKNIFYKQKAMIETFIAGYTDEKGNAWEEESQYDGFYFHEIDPGETTDGQGIEQPGFTESTSIKVFYTGRLLKGMYETGNTDFDGGQVFDTQDANVAKDNHIYNSTKTYGQAVEATWAADSTAVTLGGSGVITGFASTLKRMHYAGAHGIGIFYSSLGYGASGSGGTIPAYAPLIFEIWIPDSKEE